MSVWSLVFLTSITYVKFSDEFRMSKRLCSGSGLERLNQRTCDYSFIAFLFNPAVPNISCIGAIITSFWVIDNCVDEPWFAYESIEVGSSGIFSPTDSSAFIYSIAERTLHPDYFRTELKITGYDTRYLYAAENAVCLHKASRQIVMIPNLVDAIALHPKVYRPLYGDVVYMENSRVFTKTELVSLSRRICNEYFEPYFEEGRRINVTDKELCIEPKKVTPEECCRSQSLLIYGRKLAGIMAWSTGCSETSGVDLWVFVFLRCYINWIESVAHVKNYTASKRYEKTDSYYEEDYDEPDYWLSEQSDYYT